MMNVLLNNKGMSLIELMIAMSIILIMFLTLLMTSLLSSTANMQNIIRDEAIQIAEMKQVELGNIEFDNLPGEAGVETIAENPVALIFGSEDRGVSREALRIADKKIKFIQENTIDSLNVSVAAGICLYDLFKRKFK